MFNQINSQLLYISIDMINYQRFRIQVNEKRSLTDRYNQATASTIPNINKTIEKKNYCTQDKSFYEQSYLTTSISFINLFDCLK